MIQEFEQILEENNILYPKKHVLLGVSGGVDSVALFHLMQAIDEKKRPNISVAHINHQARKASDRDEAFVRKLADAYDVPFYSHVWEKSDHPDSGFEEAARDVRYTFFEKIMEKQGPTVLMTAHHQDDQVETVLMKLARGSSLEQLTGIQLMQPFSRGQLMRPLLSFPKEKIYAYVEENNIDYVEDATNLSLDFTRNRYRNQIIPLLKEENDKFNAHVERFAEDIRDLLLIAERPIHAAYKQLVRMKSQNLSFNRNQFFQHDEPMQRALLQQILATLYEESEVAYKTTYIEMVRNWLIEGEVNTSLDLLNHFTVRKDYQQVIFEKKTSRKEAGSKKEYSLEKINEWIELSSHEKIGVFESNGQEENESLIFHADQVKFPLTVRHRKPGDRMSYKGLSGTKKIKDIFIDEKVAPEERERAWLVEDADGRIIWLIAYRKMYLLSDIETDKIAYVIKYKKLDDKL